MPVAYVDIPTGVNDGAKKKIFQELYEEIHEAWPIPDTRVLISHNEHMGDDEALLRRRKVIQAHAIFPLPRGQAPVS